MIPLRDESRRPAGVPLATGAIIGINAVVFLLELAQGDPFVAEWAATPADIASGHRLVTLLSSMFMHASWSHIIGNMIFLWAFGPQIEDAMGRVRFIGFYLAGGLAAMAAQVAVDPSSTVPSLGASGAIAAVMGAWIGGGMRFDWDVGNFWWEVLSLLLALVGWTVGLLVSGFPGVLRASVERAPLEMQATKSPWRRRPAGATTPETQPVEPGAQTDHLSG
jgi:membrane associated rhomboid family serine protease